MVPNPEKQARWFETLANQVHDALTPDRTHWEWGIRDLVFHQQVITPPRDFYADDEVDTGPTAAGPGDRFDPAAALRGRPWANLSERSTRGPDKKVLVVEHDGETPVWLDEKLLASVMHALRDDGFRIFWALRSAWRPHYLLEYDHHELVASHEWRLFNPDLDYKVLDNNFAVANCDVRVVRLAELEGMVEERTQFEPTFFDRELADVEAFITVGQAIDDRDVDAFRAYLARLPAMPARSRRTVSNFLTYIWIINGTKGCVGMIRAFHESEVGSDLQRANAYQGLRAALDRAYDDAARELIAYGVDPNSKYISYFNGGDGQPFCEEWSYPITTPKLSCELLAFLIQSGADVNVRMQDGSTPLMHLLSSVKGDEWTQYHTNRVICLRANGADLSLKNRAGKTVHDMDLSPEIKALLTRELTEDERRWVLAGCPDQSNSPTPEEVFMAGLEGVSLQASSAFDQMRDFHLAIRTTSPKCIRMLIASGADARLVDEQGQTCLHFAVRMRAFPCIPALLDAGIDPLIKDKDGKTAADLCESLYWKAVLETAAKGIRFHCVSVNDAKPTVYQVDHPRLSCQRKDCVGDERSYLAIEGGLFTRLRNVFPNLQSAFPYARSMIGAAGPFENLDLCHAIHRHGLDEYLSQTADNPEAVKRIHGVLHIEAPSDEPKDQAVIYIADDPIDNQGVPSDLDDSLTDFRMVAAGHVVFGEGRHRTRTQCVRLTDGYTRESVWPALAGGPGLLIKHIDPRDRLPRRHCSAYLYSTSQCKRDGRCIRLHSVLSGEIFHGFESLPPEGSRLIPGDDGFNYLVLPDDQLWDGHYLISAADDSAAQTVKTKLGQLVHAFAKRPYKKVPIEAQQSGERLNDWLDRMLALEASGTCLQNCMMLQRLLQREGGYQQGMDYQFVRVDENHIWVEVKGDDGVWVSIDLGGAPAELIYDDMPVEVVPLGSEFVPGDLEPVDPEPVDPEPVQSGPAPDEVAAAVVVDAPEAAPVEHGPAGSEPEQSAPASKSMVDPAFEAQLQDIVSRMDGVPVKDVNVLTTYVAQHQRLMVIGNPDMVIPAVLSVARVRTYVIDGMGSLDEGQSSIMINDGAVDAEGCPPAYVREAGHLDRVFEAAKTHRVCLLINWERLPLSMRVRLNTWFEDDPHTDAPSHVQVISVCEEKSKDPTFVSRHDVTLDASLWLPPIHHGAADDQLVVDLQGRPDWRSMMMGPVVLDGEYIKYLPSPFVERMASCGSIRVINAPEKSRDDILRFLQASSAQGFVFYHGAEIPLRKGVKVTVDKRHFQFDHFDLPQRVLLGVQSDHPDVQGVKVVNTGLFDALLAGKRIQGGLHYSHPGWIEQHAGQGLPLFITTPLSPSQWYCLMAEAEKHDVKLRLFVAPKVNVPSALMAKADRVKPVVAEPVADREVATEAGWYKEKKPPVLNVDRPWWGAWILCLIGFVLGAAVGAGLAFGGVLVLPATLTALFVVKSTLLFHVAVMALFAITSAIAVPSLWHLFVSSHESYHFLKTMARLLLILPLLLLSVIWMPAWPLTAAMTQTVIAATIIGVAVAVMGLAVVSLVDAWPSKQETVVAEPDKNATEKFEEAAQASAVAIQQALSTLDTIQHPQTPCQVIVCNDPDQFKAMPGHADAMVLDVEGQSYASLFGGIDHDTTATGFKNFRIVKGSVLNVEKGEHVMLQGAFDNHMLCYLQPLMLGQAIEVGGEVMSFSGRLELVIEADHMPDALAFLPDDQIEMVQFAQDSRRGPPLAYDERLQMTPEALLSGAAFMKNRIDQLQTILGVVPAVCLVGETGVGKSSLIRELERRRIYRVYRGLGSVGAWLADASGNAMLFIDESNMESAPYDFLSSIPAGHTVVFARNPDDYSASRFTQKSMRHVPVMVLDHFPAVYIRDEIVAPMCVLDDRSRFESVVAPIIEAHHKDGSAVAVRALQQAVLRSQSASETVDLPGRVQGVVMTPSLVKPYRALTAFLQLRAAKIKHDIPHGLGLNGFLMEGESGTRKSVLAKAVLTEAYGDAWVYIKAGDRLEGIKHKLTMAMKEGLPVLFEEMNSIKDGLVEKYINLALTGDSPDEGSQEVLCDVANGFVLIATANGAYMPGRYRLSDAFRDRCECVEMNAVTADDMAAILADQDWDGAEAERLIAVAQERGFNLRQLDYLQRQMKKAACAPAADVTVARDRNTLFAPGGGAAHSPIHPPQPTLQ